MASPPQPTSMINATERRPSPQYASTATLGLSPPRSLASVAQLVDESDYLLDDQLSQHFSTTSRAPRRRRGQISEIEIETYQRWRVDVGTATSNQL